MNSDHRVETMSRLVQWCINSFSCPNKASMTRNYTLDSIHISDYFIIGKWKWRFVLSETKEYMKFKLSPEVPVFEAPVIASFNIRVISFLAGRKTFIHPEIRDMRLKRGDYEFKWTLDGSLTAGSVIIEAEFLDLKSIPPNGGEPHSIWSDGYKHLSTNSPALKLLGKSLSESIDTDITIYASDGNIRAHRWVLKTRSPVFERMFSYDFKENEMSTINIPDMSIEVCKSFLGYMYFNLQYQDFIDHRLDLLIAADKYYVSDLKDECEKSLIEDINTTNVLERLQFASMYRVSKLKVSCIQYLVKFGKFLDIKEEFRAFMKYDSELAAELTDEMISFGKDFCKCF